MSSTMCMKRRGRCAADGQNEGMSDEIDPKVYQAHLKAWREHRGLTSEKAGDGLGVAHTTVQRWEQATMNLNTARLVEICRLYKVTPQMLLAPPPATNQINRMAAIDPLVKVMDEETFRHLMFVAKKLG
jgi:transcriptional regulator with XRE-family HTH domain